MKSVMLAAGLQALLFTSATIGAPCDGLTGALPKGATLTTAEVVTTGELTLAGRTVRGLPAFCRVVGSLHPTADSDIRFEVWLPSTGWNNKFHGVGNGGYAGTINYAGLVDAIKNNYATASTDTGHQDPVNTSANWALNHPEKVIDFGYRAVHETAVAAKGLIRAFYGEAPKRSYFSSCSNGGRQALMEAQRFPADYDGIIAGAPAYYWSHLLTGAASVARATLAEAASYITAKKLPAIQAAALAQCDVKDGVKDGVIENPMACPFDPSVLLCSGAESDSCLTRPQLTALTTIYKGLQSNAGKTLFPGLAHGGEADPGAWANWITGTAPEKGAAMFAFGTQFFKNIIYGDPEWNYRSFDADRELKAAVERAARDLDATNADLSAFRKRGGKLILYHGWSDAAIPGASTVNYYNEVISKMGAKNADTFVRLYMVPGMGHCAGGSGPSAFGQGGTAVRETPAGDRFHNIDAALEAWVEQSLAPDTIIAAKPKVPADPAGAVTRTRPLCAWPQVAKYKGTGSTDEAANFTCAKP